MKRETLKEILLNLDLMANKEVDGKRKRSFELLKQWFKSYSENICQDSLLRIWSPHWSQMLKDSYYDFPAPTDLENNIDHNGSPSDLKVEELEIQTSGDHYAASKYRFYKVEEALFLKIFNGLHVYLVGLNESYITATSNKRFKAKSRLVLLKNDTEAILLDGSDLKLEVKAA